MPEPKHDRDRRRAEPPPDHVPAGLPRDPAPRDEGRGRLLQALLRPGRRQLVVAVILALVGFGAVTQVRSNDSDDSYAGLRQQDLIDLLNGLAGTSQRAQDEVQRLQSTRDDLMSDTRSREAALQQARQQSETLAVLNGTVPVRGPGVVITLREVSGSVTVGAFLNMVESLRTAGAESLAISDVDDQVRVVAQTAFAEDDGDLRIGGRLLSAPYTIQAVGDPAALGSALRFPDGPEDEMAADGVDLSYDERDSLTVTAVSPDAQ